MSVIHADCLDAMAAMDADSVDAIVCDPPYAYPGGFMGKAWDNFDGREDVGFGYWLAGFTDGEGCFRVQRHERGSHTCAFQIKVRRDEKGTLERIRRYVGHGTVSDCDDSSGNSNPQAKYVVQDKDGCLALVGIFRRFPLTAKKALDFDVWAEAVEEWANRPRGNRWHGGADQTRAATLKARLENVRKYVDVPWSGNRFQDWTRLWAAECLRVLKPGGHMLVFGGTRSAHRMIAGVEDAGFEVRDMLQYLYGSGFPKSHNLDGEWKGWGTALKPAHEIILLARKPLIGTVAANAAAHGTGALNVDGCRIGTDGWCRTDGGDAHTKIGASISAYAKPSPPVPGSGRWPANVCLDEDAAAMLDAQTGQLTSNSGKAFNRADKSGTAAYGDFAGVPSAGYYGDTGGASRFFYTAKASRREREAGLEGMPERVGGAMNNAESSGRDGANPANAVGGSQRRVERGEPASIPSRNHHPTVKPIALMRWLCRLVTPPNGLILDPFTGSGTTGCAAVLEGFRFVGIEREAEYVAIAEKRIAYWAGQRTVPEPDLFAQEAA